MHWISRCSSRPIKLIRLGGENDDGFMLYLKKMNLSCSKRSKLVTDSWRDRLFMAHGDIRFDDYDKISQTFPPQSLKAYSEHFSSRCARFSFFIN